MEHVMIRTNTITPLTAAVIDMGPIRCRGPFVLDTSVPTKVCAYPSMKATSANPAPLSMTTPARFYEFQAGATMNACTSVTMPSGWVPGSSMTPYIQFYKVAAGTGTVRWTLYAHLSTDGVYNSVTTVNTVTTDVATLDHNTTYTITFPTLSAVGMVDPCKIDIQITREGLSDTYANSTLLTDVYVVTLVNRLN